MNIDNYIINPISVSKLVEDKDYLKYSEDVKRGGLLEGNFIVYQNEKIVYASKCDFDTIIEKVRGITSKGNMLMIKVGSTDIAYLIQGFRTQHF